MNIEPEKVVTVAVFIFSLGGTWGWMKGKIKRHDERITAIERSLTDDKGRPLLVSYADHKNLCDAKQLVSDTKLDAFEKDLNEIKEAVKDIPKLAQMIYELKGKIR